MDDAEQAWVGKPLPYAEAAVIPDGKLTEYVLNAEHPVGKHKARVFSSTLAIEACDAEFLAGQILAEVKRVGVVGVRAGFAGGTEFTAPVTVMGRNKTERTVITAWYLEDGGTVPRLTTAYVKP